MVGATSRFSTRASRAWSVQPSPAYTPRYESTHERRTSLQILTRKFSVSDTAEVRCLSAAPQRPVAGRSRPTSAADFSELGIRCTGGTCYLRRRALPFASRSCLAARRRPAGSRRSGAYSLVAQIGCSHRLSRSRRTWPVRWCRKPPRPNCGAPETVWSDFTCRIALEFSPSHHTPAGHGG